MKVGGNVSGQTEEAATSKTLSQSTVSSPPHWPIANNPSFSRRNGVFGGVQL